MTKPIDILSLELDREQVKDVKNIARGVYAPLKGFLRKADFESVVKRMRLTDGTIWPIPIVLDIDVKHANKIKGLSEVLLRDHRERRIAVLKNPEVYTYDRDLMAESVFGTRDQEHPGVSGVYAMKDRLVGGEVELIDDSREPFPEYNFSPEETRKIFNDRGWEKVVAFQTRNVPHRGHEFLQKFALSKVDGLFIQPVIGEKKVADFKDEYIVTSYQVLIDNYYPKDKVLLGILPLKMRYAGPREAVFHALVRKNFGCTHFIVGRDHAGVGSYYPPFAAQEVFDQFNKDELGIEVMKLPEVVYYKGPRKHHFVGEYPTEEQISFSGTRLREYVENKKQPPEYLIRPKVYEFLVNSHNALVDDNYKNMSNKKGGFVLWFTGLSGSGKSSVADAVFEALFKKGIRTERLDGDIVREYLSKDLGFSKKDRDENIRRVGFVAELLSRNGVGVVASFISPYRAIRKELKDKIKNFFEVFCNCPLEVCEARDTKGLYAKARKGEIENFTGISDPYEEPQDPALELKTDRESLEENTQKVLNFLQEKGFV